MVPACDGAQIHEPRHGFPTPPGEFCNRRNFFTNMWLFRHRRLVPADFGRRNFHLLPYRCRRHVFLFHLYQGGLHVNICFLIFNFKIKAYSPTLFFSGKNPGLCRIRQFYVRQGGPYTYKRRPCRAGPVSDASRAHSTLRLTICCFSQTLACCNCHCYVQFPFDVVANFF